MNLRTKRSFILAALEVSYGTLVSLTGADAVLTNECKVMPLEGSTVSRNLDRPGFGADQQLHVGVHVAVEFNVEMVGSGTLGVAPAWGRLMLACACAEAIAADTSVIYTPDADSTDSLSIAYFIDGQRHAMKGARGTVKIKFDSQGIPYLNFVFTGLWVDPATISPPGSFAGFDDFLAPRPVTNADTPTVSLHGLDVVLKSFSFDQGNQVEHIDNPGEESVEIVDRESKGSIEVLAPILSTHNYFTEARANTLGPMKIVHGTDTASRVIFESPGDTVQLLQPKYGDDKGRATMTAQLSYAPTSAQDDDWQIRLAAA